MKTHIKKETWCRECWWTGIGKYGGDCICKK